MRLTLLVCALPMLVATTRDAAADGVTTADAFTDRPFAIVLIAGATTPVGLGGVALEGTPVRWLTIGAGAGMSSGGVQVAWMPRVRFYTGEHHGWSIGAGVSGGKYNGCPPCGANATGNEAESHATGWAWWANFDVGLEGRSSESGFTYRVFAGVARPFGGCLGGYGEECAGGGVLPMLGIAVGSML